MAFVRARHWRDPGGWSREKPQPNKRRSPLQPAERARAARVREPRRDCTVSPACGCRCSRFSCLAAPLGARAPVFPLFRCSRASSSACSARRSLVSRASRSMIARFIFGVKNRSKIQLPFGLAFGPIWGSKMERKTLQNRAPELPKTLSEHVSCRTLFPDSFLMLFGPPGTSKIVLPCTREHDF